MGPKKLHECLLLQTAVAVNTPSKYSCNTTQSGSGSLLQLHAGDEMHRRLRLCRSPRPCLPTGACTTLAHSLLLATTAASVLPSGTALHCWALGTASVPPHSLRPASPCTAAATPQPPRELKNS
jgi:hypothetical protein